MRPDRSGVREMLYDIGTLMHDIYRSILIFPKGDEVKYVRMANPVSQETYLKTQLQWMKDAKRRILIFGYDAPFMDQEETGIELAKAVHGEDYGRLNRVDVSVIVPEAQNCRHLDELADYPNFTLLRTPIDLDMGFFIFDRGRVTTWDRTEPTEFLPERASGAPHRRRYENEYLSFFLESKFERIFNEHRKKFAHQ